MTVADKFLLFGSGDGWPSVDSGITSVNVRPYVAPSFSNSYTATGFEKFQTLGGYSNSDSGNPTQEQLNLSLINAMKIFYNIETTSRASAQADITGADGVAASVNSSNLVYNTKHINPNLNTNLTPRERVLATITGKHNGNSIFRNRLESTRVTDGYSPIGIPIGTGATIRMSRSIARLYDNSQSPKLFLGYGLKNENSSGDNYSNSDVDAGVTFQDFFCDATCGIGSYFNRNSDSQYFKPADDFPNQVSFDIRKITFDDMPLLSFSQARYFDGGDNAGSASASGFSASSSLPDYNLEASVSMSGSSTFYTYS